MLSGVGPADELKAHGIPVIADLPGVGAHLQDHPVIDYFYEDKSKTSLNFLRPTKLSHKLSLVKSILQYQLFRTGPLTCNVRSSPVPMTYLNLVLAS